jgi:hypothetical protein
LETINVISGVGGGGALFNEGRFFFFFCNHAYTMRTKRENQPTRGAAAMMFTLGRCFLGTEGTEWRREPSVEELLAEGTGAAYVLASLKTTQGG